MSASAGPLSPRVSQKKFLSNPCCRVQSRKMWHFLVPPTFRHRSRGSVRDSKVNKTQIDLVLWRVNAIDTAGREPAEDVAREKKRVEDEGDWIVRRLNGRHWAPAALQSGAPKWDRHVCVLFLFSAKIMMMPMKEVETFIRLLWPLARSDLVPVAKASCWLVKSPMKLRYKSFPVTFQLWKWWFSFPSFSRFEPDNR